MSLHELQQITGGTVQGRDVAFNAVSTDTRTLQGAELFIALSGPNFNGNAFVDEAERKGACAAVISEAVATALPTLQVADSRIALGQLGAENRLRSKARVLALTGSQGKTTVKEMTAAILAQCGAVHCTRGNLNNDLGVPLTLLELQAGHQFAVIELGANAPGEIACTTAMTRPDIAHITNVAPTHLEGFGSIQGVARGKAELWSGLQEHGVAIINLDDPNILSCFAAGTSVRVVTISAAGCRDADFRVTGVQDFGLEGSSFTLETPEGSAAVRLNLPGAHNVANALAAAALAMTAGAGLVEVVVGVAGVQPVKGRLTVREGSRGSVVLDDTYNASPVSFRAAIDVLARRRGRKVLVSGDMGELGAEAVPAHVALGKYARECGVDRVYGTGNLSRHTVLAFGDKGSHYDDLAELAAALLPVLAPEVTVLVKGSRSAGMERVVKLITEQEG